MMSVTLLTNPTHPVTPEDATGAVDMGVDPENAPLLEVGESICQWAGRFAAATCGWLGMLAAFDRRGGWAAIGIKSCAHWLSWRCGLGLRTAREHLATAHALESLPAIRAAFAAGELSYSKIRAVTRVATPDTESFWLNHAYHCTASQLDRLAAATHAATTSPTKQRNTRHLTLRTDPDGMLRITAVLPPDDAALVLAALDAAGTSLDTTTPPADQHPPADGTPVLSPRDRTRDADALTALAEAFLHHGPPTLQDTPRTLNIHVTATATSPTSGDHGGLPAGTGTVGGWTLGLPAAVIRRLGCDGHLRALLTDPRHNPLHLGRRRRLPTRRLRDAIYTRDHGHCQYPTCDHTHWLHIHHLTPWEQGGATNIDNLLLVCGSHHRTIHDHNLTLTRAPDGTITVQDTHGETTLTSTPPPPRPSRADADLAAVTSHLTPTTIHTRDGGPFSLDESLFVLLQRSSPGR